MAFVVKRDECIHKFWKGPNRGWSDDPNQALTFPNKSGVSLLKGEYWEEIPTKQSDTKCSAEQLIQWLTDQILANHEMATKMVQSPVHAYGRLKAIIEIETYAKVRAYIQSL